MKPPNLFRHFFYLIAPVLFHFSKISVNCLSVPYLPYVGKIYCDQVQFWHPSMS